MSHRGKGRRSTKNRQRGYYSVQFSKTIGKYNKWRGKVWDGIKLLGKSLKTTKKKAYERNKFNTRQTGGVKRKGANVRSAFTRSKGKNKTQTSG